ncbi:hypothetical protein QYE76_005826 [Lolium multiflorum]|uniref:Uncharacterized protein n=1 Tax=Lolium multiflorum TaxID=4521 RepID=A0AAD8RX54_LOLMU|nr:hypothetical protein QYE76_005826 [Lolium multiflorum]
MVVGVAAASSELHAVWSSELEAEEGLEATWLSELEDEEELEAEGEEAAAAVDNACEYDEALIPQISVSRIDFC